MIKKNWISVITPCYNTAHLVVRLLDSILMQDYPFVEMIVIDDGSTDNIKEITDIYKDKFLKKKYSFTFIQQENCGQSVAINNALKLCMGEFLTWPDSDDYITDSHYYSKMVAKLKNSLTEHITSVRCLPSFVDEKTLRVTHKQKYIDSKKSIFEECLWASNNFWFPPICYMVKISSIDALIAFREIYTEKNAGQNWQIMLPLFYRHECILMPEYCVNVLERGSSHSRGQYSTYLQQSKKYLSYQNTIRETLRKIDADMCGYIHKIDSKYYGLQISLALAHNEKKAARYYFKKMWRLPMCFIPIKYFADYLLSFVPGYKRVLKFYYKVRQYAFKYRKI